MKTFQEFGISIPSGSGDDVHVTCPQCSASRKKKQAKCLSVTVSKGKWLCHHCGWAGGLDEAPRRVDVGWRKPQYRRPEAPREAGPRDRVDAWFLARGIPQCVLDRNRITSVSVYMPQVEDHVTAIAFPYYRGDDLVNVKYRDKDKNFRMEAGAERILYGLADIAPERCVIVEGEIDKLSVEVAGLTSCVSVPDGAPTPDAKNYASKFTFLESDEERIGAVKEWILAVDNDPAGQRLEDELARRLGREKCRRVTWPQGCKDANDVLVKSGPQALRECLDSAELYPLSGVFEIEDLSDRIDRLYENGWERGVSTGWDEVDQYYTVRPGEMTVVTGMPNSGKSNWLDALTVNLAEQHGWHIAIFSPENQPLEDHMARMCEKWAGAPFAEGPTLRMTREELNHAKAAIGAHFTWILPDNDSEWTVETVLDRTKSLVLRKGIRGLVIDPWNELEHALPQGMSETMYIGNALKHIRQFARQHGVHVWVVAHPQKIYREKSTGEYPVPTLYDISGSANWRNKADNGVVLFRNFTEPHSPVEVHVQKVRFRQIGKIGMAKLNYKAATQTYQELGFHDPRNRFGSSAGGIPV